MKLLQAFLVLLGMVCLLSCNKNIIKVPDSPFPISDDAFTTQIIATDFTIPYGIAIISDEEYYISDRVGKLFHYLNDDLTAVNGVPDVVTFGTPGMAVIMHGGLMDISLHPKYVENGWLYITYLATDGHATVDRIRIIDDVISESEQVFKSRQENYTGNGMRLVWEDDEHFFLNIGNSDWSTSEYPVMNAQDLGHDAGKIHRLMEDGSIPVDNPVFEWFDEPSTIWSYGHRDVQGLYYEESTGILYGMEHGPKGGDELNIIEKGKNYGWPLFTYGINYDGGWVSVISEDSAETFTEFPELWWTVDTRDGGQAVAPACLWKVTNSSVEDWNGQFLFGSLAYRRLMRFDLKTGKTHGINVDGRVRTVKQLPGGDLIALIGRNDLRKTNGKVVRISP